MNVFHSELIFMNWLKFYKKTLQLETPLCYVCDFT